MQENLSFQMKSSLSYGSSFPAFPPITLFLIPKQTQVSELEEDLINLLSMEVFFDVHKKLKTGQLCVRKSCPCQSKAGSSELIIISSLSKICSPLQQVYLTPSHRHKDGQDAIRSPSNNEKVKGTRGRKPSSSSSSMSSSPPSSQKPPLPDRDIFGQPLYTALKETLSCVHCRRVIGATRFAPHLEKVGRVADPYPPLQIRRIFFISRLCHLQSLP